MNGALSDIFSRVRDALIAGHPEQALTGVETLLTNLRDQPLDDADKAAAEARLTELRVLAEAALTGARSAARQIDEIIETARSLCTYDRGGHRRVAAVASDQPRRF